MKKISIILALFFGLTSCSDFLEKEPVEQISINDQFSSTEGLLKALNGVYYNTRSTQFFLANYTYGDLLSGNISFSKTSISAFVSPLYNFDDDPNDSKLKTFYSNSYQVINNINLILENIEKVPQLNEKVKNEVKAEALAMRAFIHYQLLKIYAQNYTYTKDASHLGIVYTTRTLVVGIDYPERNTVKESYIFLEKDLQEALQLFQDFSAIPDGEQKNFMNKNAAKTLYASIALDKGDYLKAISLSNEVINTSGINLSTKEEYINNFAVNESIFEIANTGGNESYIKNIYNPKNGISEYVISKDLIQLFDKNDERLKLIANGNTANTKDFYFTKKYAGTITGLVYRLTELYFIRAEAALKSGDINTALSDINTIRNRVGLENITTISLDNLLEEKRKEFVFENRYFFDLMRNHKNITRQNGCVSKNCNLNYPNNKFVVPIPFDALKINSHLQQNPGY